MQDYTLVRQGLPPLKFTGTIIGQGNIGSEPSGVTVTIYRTKAGRYIAQIERRHREEIVYRNAAHYPAPSDIIIWLKEGEDTLGKASQDAIEKACENDPEFAGAWVETVE
jgi:hypothetical protein